MTKRYLVRTFGCQMNEHDSERIAGLLEADGMIPADGLDDADVVVLNTCCVRENADNRLYGNLGQLKAVKDVRPELQIAVAGCLAQKDRELVRENAPYVDVVFGTHNVNRAAELLRQASESGPVVEILEAIARDDAEHFPSALPARRELDHAAWVTIQIGCDNSCAFCIVPSVRGPEISRPFGEILDEVRDLARDGVMEVTLLGQNVNSYGRDITTGLVAELTPVDGERTDIESLGAAHLAGEGWATSAKHARVPLFADLLRAVGEVQGIRRVRFTSPHPKDLRPETITAMAEVSSVCEHLHLPLQSGSDRVLAEMHRGYTADRYLEKLRTARHAVRDLAVSTDIIVGFPGETEEDFVQTLELAAEARFDSAFTFIYSPRPGTPAATRSNEFIDPGVASERFERLRNVVERSALLANQARIGIVEEAVVEGPSRKDVEVTSGRTRQNRLVHFKTGLALKPGTLVDVRVTEAAPHHMMGDLIGVLAEPPRRRRIPVQSL